MQARITFDEKKAAEAAFNGYWPVDPTWSPSAQQIYEGLVEALANRALKQAATELQPA
jgi:hypothetical protein